MGVAAGKIKESWAPSKLDKNRLELLSKDVVVNVGGDERETLVCVAQKDPVCGRLEIRNKSTGLVLGLEYTGKVFKYDYEFDRAGNWTKKTESQQVDKFGKKYFEPIVITTREVSYY